MLKVVCVFVLQGLLARVFSTASYVDGMHDVSSGHVLVEGVAEFRGIVPASGSVTVSGNYGCFPFFPVNPPVVGNAAIHRNEYLTPVNRENPWISSNVNQIYNTDPVYEPSTEEFQYDNINYMDDLSKKVLFGSLIADSIIGGKEAEIEASLAEINSIVNSELSKANSIIETALDNATNEEINSLLNFDLSDIESKMDIMEIIIESELEKVDQVLEFMLEDKNTMMELEQTVMELLTELRIVPSGTEISQVDMDEALAEIDKIVEAELALIDLIIESELAKVDLFIEAELAKMGYFVETKEALVQALIDTELNNTNMYMDSELDEIGALLDCKPFMYPEQEMVEMPMQGVAQFSGIVPAAGKVSLFGSNGYSPIFDNFEVVPEPQLAFDGGRLATTDYTNMEEMPEAVMMGEMSFSGIVPAQGRVNIYGGFGCPPSVPSNPPIVANAAPCIKNNGVSLSDRITSALLAREQYNAHNSDHTGFPPFPTNPPVVGNAGPYIQNDGFHLSDRHTSALLSTEQYNTRNNYPTDALSQVKYLPPVNLNYRNRMKSFEECTEDTVELNGRTRATGRITVFANFGCAPLLPTQEGPDGKKYIWLLNRPNNSVIPAPPRNLQPRPRFPGVPMYPTSIPETDANKIYETFIDDPVSYHDTPVVGNMIFEGVVPAFGSVSLKGHA